MGKVYGRFGHLSCYCNILDWTIKIYVWIDIRSYSFLQGDQKHLILAHLFDKPCFLGLLAVKVFEGIPKILWVVCFAIYGYDPITVIQLLKSLFPFTQADDISNFHANTHIPVVIGSQMRYEVTGDPIYKVFQNSSNAVYLIFKRVEVKSRTLVFLFKDYFSHLTLGGICSNICCLLTMLVPM